jgi:GntR family transcriptional regulator of vanillate catabolism
VFDAAEILQAYEIRAVLEGLAAKRAAQLGIGEAGRRTIEEALAAGDRLLARGHLLPEDRIAYGTSNAAIHGAILAAAGARMLGDLLRLTQQVAPSSHRNVVAFEYHDVRRRHDDHHRIYEAILGRDAARAELLMRGHVESVRLAMTRSAGWTGGERAHG